MGGYSQKPNARKQWFSTGENLMFGVGGLVLCRECPVNLIQFAWDFIAKFREWPVCSYRMAW